MSFSVSTSGDLKKYACGEHCQAVLEVTNVKTVNAAKFKKTIIQGRTSDSKYIVITYGKAIRLDLMLGDVAFFMDTVVGKNKDKDNHFIYDWELKENSKIRLLKRSGNNIGKDVFPGAPEITPPSNAFNNQKKLSTNETPNPGSVKKETQKPINKPPQKKERPKKVDKRDDSKSDISKIFTNKAKTQSIQGYLYEDFKTDMVNDGDKRLEFFVSKVEKDDGNIVPMMVSKAVMLPLLLKKGYRIHLTGQDINFYGEITRIIENDSQIIFKGFGKSEEHKNQLRKAPELMNIPFHNQHLNYSSAPLYSRTVNNPNNTGFVQMLENFSQLLGGRQPPRSN